MGINHVRIWCIFFSFAFCALSNGCIVIPANFYSSGSRQNVSDEIMDLLHVGKTTKEEVFVSLGEPDIINADDRCIIYLWDKVRLILIPLVPVQKGADPVLAAYMYRTYELILCFDDQGILNRKEVRKKIKID